jgi:hypothetical protein
MQKRLRIPKIDRMRDAIEEIGGEALDGSGFENETPDAEFSGACALPSTLPRVRTRESH